MDFQKLKFHLILSVVTIFICAILYAVSLGTPDPPTTASLDRVMKKISLDGLPPVWTPTESGDAGIIYEEAFSFFMVNKDALNGKSPPHEMTTKISDLLIRAKNCSNVPAGFADTAPLEPGSQPDYANAPRRSAALICGMVDDGLRSGSMNEADAEQMLLGVWAMGQRLFMNNTRLFSRTAGISCMMTAHGKMSLLKTPSPAAKPMAVWMAQLERISAVWELKKSIFSYEANVSDLQRIADLDEDRTFRLEAVLQMGVARWTRPTRGNVRLIASTLDKYMQGSDPEFAKAAKAASTSTREQIRVLH